MRITLASLRQRLRRVKIELRALCLAARHPGTPWYARALIVGSVVYALTPSDLFPDVLPVFGFVDDLIFVPLALGLAARFVPGPVLAECRERAAEKS
jgi:uncharacterized membrane protein YkvA (DUF1232 family)